MRRSVAARIWLVGVFFGAPALAACPDLHDIEDMVSAGFSSRVIRSVVEETGWPVCLSQEDIDRLRRRGIEEDVLAFLEERAQEPLAPAEIEEPEAVPPSPYTAGYPYASVYPYGYGGLFFGGGGFHHHHHHDHDFAGHHWAGIHDEGFHAGVGGTGFHGGPFAGHAGTHLGGHGAHADGGHGGHAGHGGHGGVGHGGGGHGGGGHGGGGHGGH